MWLVNTCASLIRQFLVGIDVTRDKIFHRGKSDGHANRNYELGLYINDNFMSFLTLRRTNDVNFFLAQILPQRVSF